MLPKINAEGRCGSDPELRFTPQGVAVATVSMACTKRVKKGDTWEDGDTTWLRLTFWRAAAEQVAEHVSKGDLLVISGDLLVREYEAKDGTKGKSVEVDVQAWGKVPRKAPQRTESAPTADPWATPAPAEPPF
jgi:single-strand DNA-binding protein